MIKKGLFIYIISILLLTGCTNNNSEDNKTSSIKNTSKPKAFSSSLKPTPGNSLTLPGESVYSTRYLTNGSLVFFPNTKDNNFISVTSTNIENGDILADSIIDTFSYSTESLAAVDNIIYFSNISDNNSLYKLDYIKKKVTKVLDISISQISSTNKLLYFININNNYLSCLDLNTNTVKSITTDRCDNYIINGNYIIYENLDDGSCLYSIKIDGTERTKLTTESINSFTTYNENNIIYINARDNNLYTYNTLLKQSKMIYKFKGRDLKSYNNKFFFIDLDNSNHLSSIEIDPTFSNISTKELTKDIVNDYYPTPLGVFFKKPININKDFLLKYE